MWGLKSVSCHVYMWYSIFLHIFIILLMLIAFRLCITPIRIKIVYKYLALPCYGKTKCVHIECWINSIFFFNYLNLFGWLCQERYIAIVCWIYYNALSLNQLSLLIPISNICCVESRPAAHMSRFEPERHLGTGRKEGA